jgi:hypothetical protein
MLSRRFGDNGSMSVQGPAPYLMPVGDPRRLLLRRAAFGTLVAAAIFFAFTVSKQIKPIYYHAPWENDPYDTVFSFTMFFVPLLAACLLVQVSLCRKSEPLSTQRVVAILRGCRVTVGAIVIELLTAWVAVVVGANRSQWTGGATGVLLALLILSTIVTGKVVVDLRRVPRLRSPDRVQTGQGSDWLADVVAVAQRESHRLGPIGRPGLAALAWIDRAVVSEIRGHPLVAAAMAGGVFGVTVFGWQGIREGYVLSVTLLSMALGFFAMFAFLVLAGSHLGVVQSPHTLYGVQRRAVDASVVACVVAVTVLAFRDSLWWTVGSSPSAAGPGQFASLLAGTTVLAFAMVFIVEMLLRSHCRPAY